MLGPYVTVGEFVEGVRLSAQLAAVFRDFFIRLRIRDAFARIEGEGVPGCGLRGACVSPVPAIVHPFKHFETF